MGTANGQHGERNAPSAIIMAAGLGKRMQSDLPKVLHEVGDRPMVCAVIDACRAAGCERVVLIVGHKRELVKEMMAAEYGDAPWLEYVVQDQQLGTGHAVLCAKDVFYGVEAGQGDVFVLAGDGPLIRASTLTTLLARHRDSGARATLATSTVDDPAGYGRIARDAQGQFEAIVEQKNCTDEQLAINEINPSYYCFDVRALFDALDRVQRNELTGEYYVTDVLGLLNESAANASDRAGSNGEGGVEVVAAVPAEDVLSINTLEHLAKVDAIYRSRHEAGAAGQRSTS